MLLIIITGFHYGLCREITCNHCTWPTSCTTIRVATKVGLMPTGSETSGSNCLMNPGPLLSTHGPKSDAQAFLNGDSHECVACWLGAQKHSPLVCYLFFYICIFCHFPMSAFVIRHAVSRW